MPASGSSARSPELIVAAIAEGLVYPWSLALLPGPEDRFLVTERPGRMRVLDEHGLHAPLAGLPRSANLLHVAVAPDFSLSARVYFSLVREERGVLALEIWTARLLAGALLESRRVYRAQAQSDLPTVLTSGRLLVTGAAELILSIADLEDAASRAQHPRLDWGKLVRVQANGEAHVVASGVRNSQGMLRDRDGTVWFTDHGPLGGDELNRLRVGANYGWPLSSLGRHYDGMLLPSELPGTQAPVVHWTPAIAPSSLIAYEGAEFPEWRGSFLVSSLAQAHLRRLEVRGGVLHSEEVLLAQLRERPRDLTADSVGRLYILTDGLHGRILRITRARPVRLFAPAADEAKGSRAAAALPEAAIAIARDRRSDVHRLDPAARHCAVRIGNHRRVSGAECALHGAAR
jgi:aldose sugar dehydrogenase